MTYRLEVSADTGSGVLTIFTMTAPSPAYLNRARIGLDLKPGEWSNGRRIVAIDMVSDDHPPSAP